MAAQKSRPRGLYEQLVTRELESGLQALESRLAVRRAKLDPAEAADRIALHVAAAVRRSVMGLADEKRVVRGIALAREITIRLAELLDEPELEGDAPLDVDSVLRAIVGRRPDGHLEVIEEPLIPLLDTTLLTNAPGEPRVGRQIEAEIASADRIDIVMAFIRRSGIAPLIQGLRRHREAGRPLRVLTTTFTGTTEASALALLADVGAEVRVSYDISTTRLHAKAWLFHRESGFSTAYIGSSNLTHSAQVTGLEWNVRVSQNRNPDVVAKFSAVFDSYWNGSEFEPWNRDRFEASIAADARAPSTFSLPPTELRPERFQERMLEQLAVEREGGRHRNLVVAATGTGKTVIAAIDYARLRRSLPRARLLFVAHREELLEQACATFRHALREPAFGERWVGGARPRRFDHVFASIQSLARNGLRDLEPTWFDVVIVDEFHHAAAPSYAALLERIRPLELIGLTATPERSDGLPILNWFDGRIAVELRLWDAIDQQRLVPFSYFGIHDGTRLDKIPWRRGRGYDVDGLTNVLTADDAWVHLVLVQLVKHVDDPSTMRALGFCASVDHARFMARKFVKAGIAAVAVTGDTPDAERGAALDRLARREVNVVFSVDLFNEGIDIPSVDTLLLLRPTDSPTLFLQQLGRGLRRAPGKSVCTVLDFVGFQHREFRFDRRFGALLGGNREALEVQVASGFPLLPAGCHMELDPVARDEVLRSIREAIPSRWNEKADELRRSTGGGTRPRLACFLDQSRYALEDVYTGGRSWSDLIESAGIPVAARGPNENQLRRACGRLLHVDDRERIDGWRKLLRMATPPAAWSLLERERRLVRMLVAAVTDQVISRTTTVDEALLLLWAHPQIRIEIDELLEFLATRIDHIHEPLATEGDARLGPTLGVVPLRLHARYSRLEILAAFEIEDVAKAREWREGVLWVKHARADLFAFTIDKSSGHFSPTTRYRDYAISRDLIHWESQSSTREHNETGLRYQRHIAQGSSILLFARRSQDDRDFWLLGSAQYVSHQGERPMAITWKLDHSLPPDLYSAMAAVV